MAALHEYLFTSTAALVLGGIFILYFVVDTIIQHRKLSHIRGPRLASFSRIYVFWSAIHGRTWKVQYDALRKYGSPFARIGSDLLVTDDAEVIRHMASPRSNWRRSGWNDGMRLDPRRDSVFSTRDEALHSDLKSRMIGGYQGRDIDTLEPDIDARIVDLMNLLRNTYDRRSLDLSNVAQMFTLDVLSTVAFGAPFGNLEANKDVYGYAQASEESLMFFELITNHVFFRRLLTNSFVSKLLAPKDSDELGFGQVIRVAKESVAERFAEGAKDKADLLGYFKKKGLDQVQCECESALQVLAGSDSTSITIRCLLFRLTSTPTAYIKLRTEIDEAIEKGNLSYPVATYAETQKLPYLSACIWEGLRMYPPLMGFKGKQSPKGGDTVKGVYIPEGTEVALCDIGLCRKEEVFGEDSHMFRPDRWTEADPETRHRYQSTMDTLFGAGKYTCLGKHIAMVELHKVFVELFRNFDWAITDPMRGVDWSTPATHVTRNMNITPYARVR